MSSADLYEDGFPHGTKEGYDWGCRGSACPGALEAGQTCSTAKARYNGDYAYRKLVDSGMTPQQIRDAEQPAPVAEIKPKLRAVDAKPVARPKPPAPTPVAAELEQWPDDEPDVREATAEITVDPTTGKTIPLEEHGTPVGYRHGCRDINCPGVKNVGRSCRAAITEYQAEKKRERIARAKQAEPVAPAPVEEPADDVAPELNADELAHVTAFGLHEPQQEEPALAEWELELLGMTEDATSALAKSDDDRDVVVPLATRSDAWRAREYDDLEQKYLQLLRERLAQPAQHLTAVGGRTIKITLVGDACEITVSPAS